MKTTGNRKLIGLAAALLASAAGIQSTMATAVGFTFGDGTQGPTSGSAGPGAAQSAGTWNNVNAWPMPNHVEDIQPPPTLPWSLSYWPNGSNRGDNSFYVDMTVNVGTDSLHQATKVSDGSTLATPMTLTYHDDATYWSFYWNGEYGSGPVIEPGPNTQPYDQKQVRWTGSGSGGGSHSYFEFRNIPVALLGGSYSVFVGGSGFTVPTLLNLTSPTFRLETPGNAGTLRLSYIQFVSASLPPGYTYTTFSTVTYPGIGPESADYDKDGLTNLMEYLLGTDPTVNSNPAIIQTRAGGRNVISFTRPGTASPDFPSESGIVYRVEYSENLTNWFPVQTLGPPAAGSGPDYLVTESITDTTATGSEARRFIRLFVSKP